MEEELKKILERSGIKDFDSLTDVERETYFKMLEVAESGKITLEDWQKNVKKMRESVDYSLATDDLSPVKDLFLKARLRCYLLMEAFFEKPERAKEMLQQYGRTAKPIK